MTRTMRILLTVPLPLLLGGCAVRPQTVLRWPSDPIAGVRVYKLGSSGYADSLIKWSGYYAGKMGLSKPELIFQQLPNKWCGLALPPLHATDVLIAYDLSKWCEFSWNARDAALHETCHFKLGHTRGPRSEMLDEQQKHKEVATCMEAYR